MTSGASCLGQFVTPVEFLPQVHNSNPVSRYLQANPMRDILKKWPLTGQGQGQERCRKVGEGKGALPD
jgi:hypothetical protein